MDVTILFFRKIWLHAATTGGAYEIRVKRADNGLIPDYHCPIALAGHVDNDVACTGSAYSDPYGNWGNVIVLGSLKITL